MPSAGQELGSAGECLALLDSCCDSVRQPPIEGAILDRLGYVRCDDALRLPEIGDGARDLEDSDHGPRGEAELFERGVEKLLSIGAETTVSTQQRVLEGGIDDDRGPASKTESLHPSSF